jgi:hypothetical protein
MRSFAYILIGDNNTGKTTLQKEMIYILASVWYDRLDRNKTLPIMPNFGQRDVQEVFFINRSYQENQAEYGSVSNYFSSFFNDTGACVLSSHLVRQDISDMITELHKRFYDVGGVFFENSIAQNPDENARISNALPWDERIYIKNPFDAYDRDKYIRAGAIELCMRLMDK